MTPAALPIALAVGVLAISTAALFIRWCDDAPAVVIAAARMGLAAIALAPIGLGLRRGAPLTLPRGSRGPAIWAGLFLGAHFYFWITSLKHTSVLSSVVIVTTNPIFVGIASLLLFREPLHRRLVAGILLAVAGGVIIMWSDASAVPGSMYGNLMALGGALAASSYWLIGRRVRRDVHVVSYLLVVYSVAAALLVALAWAHGVGFAGYRAKTYVCFALLALVPQLIGHGALNYALRHLSATIVAICILGEPIGAAAMAWMFLGEPIGPTQAVGSGLILAGILASAWPAKTMRIAPRGGTSDLPT